MRITFLAMLCIVGVSVAEAAQEHCLVVGAMARAGYDTRLQLLVGTDSAFATAYWTMQADSKRVSEKYLALMRAVDSKKAEENPENHGGSFKSTAERNAFFRRWSEEIKTLEDALNAEVAGYSGAFDRAIASTTASATRDRVARINDQFAKESRQPCYWGKPK
jgi:hypothetical protein